MNNQVCNSCGSVMPFFRSEEGSETDGISYCTNDECELAEMQQPRFDRQSIVSFHRSGGITVMRKGRFTVNEGNLKSVIERLKKHLTDGKKIEATKGSKETGSDLTLFCSDCSRKRDIQVTRILDSEYAKSASNKDVVWKTYETMELLSLINTSIEKKTHRYPPESLKKMCLVLEPTVDVFWSVILKMDLVKLREYFSDQLWFSIVLVSPNHVITVSGEDLGNW